MGRLTDNLLAAVGMKTSDRVALVNADQADKEKQTASQCASTDTKQTASKNTPAKDMSVLIKEFSSASRAVTETKKAPVVAGSQQQEVEDCLGCRVVGTAVPIAAAAYVTWTVFTKNLRQLKGRQFWSYRAFGVTFSTMLVSLGVCRWFDLGPFNRENSEVSLVDQVKSDAQGLSRLLATQEQLKRKDEAITDIQSFSKILSDQGAQDQQKGQ